MKGKRLVSIYLVALWLSLFSSGCHDRIELEDLGIVVAMGIDREDEGYTMSVHIIKPQPTGGDGGVATEEIIWVGSSSGQSLFDASKNLRARASAQLTFMHNRIIIIGEETAREGLDDIFDFLTRNREIRYASWVLIAQGSAQEALQVTPELQPTFYEEVQGLIENQDEWAKQETNRIKELAISLNNPYKDIVTARMLLIEPQILGVQEEETEEIAEDQESIMLDGSAVIQGTKMIGWLTKTETRSLLFLEGLAEEALIVTPFKDGNVSIEIGGVDTEIKPGFNDGSPQVEVNISGLGRIAETDVFIDFTDLDENEELQRRVNQRVASEIYNSIEKFQGAYNADILGVGDMYYREHTNWWKKNRDQWFNGLYKDLQFDVRVEIDLDNSGFLLQPIIEGD